MAPERLSALLAHAVIGTAERVSLDDLIATLRERSYGGVMMGMAAPAMLLPPGLSSLLGVPLLVISTQLLLGRATPWLPPRLRRLSLSRSIAERVVAKTNPGLDRLESLLQPRLPVLLRRGHLRLVAMVSMLLSVVLCLPVPFAHTAAGLAVTAFGAGLMAADGMALIFGWGLALACAALFASLATATGVLLSRIL